MQHLVRRREEIDRRLAEEIVVLDERVGREERPAGEDSVERPEGEAGLGAALDIDHAASRAVQAQVFLMGNLPARYDAPKAENARGCREYPPVDERRRIEEEETALPVLRDRLRNRRQRPQARELH